MTPEPSQIDKAAEVIWHKFVDDPEMAIRLAEVIPEMGDWGVNEDMDVKMALRAAVYEAYKLLANSESRPNDDIEAAIQEPYKLSQVLLAGGTIMRVESVRLDPDNADNTLPVEVRITFDADFIPLQQELRHFGGLRPPTNKSNPGDITWKYNAIMRVKPGIDMHGPIDHD